MRFRFFLLVMLPLLLGACAKTNAPVRLDFIGNATLTSGSKTVSPTDTLTTRAYAAGNDYELQRLRITATYEPGLSPIVYPSPLSSYDPTKNAPAGQQIVYLDSLIQARPGQNGSPISEYLFVNQFTARATSGTELWQYTISDNAGQSASRAYRLTARKTDSASVAYHTYTLRLRAVPQGSVAKDSVRGRARVFLNLRYGLQLPKYAVTNQPLNQQLIDLIGVSNGLGFRLSTPLDPDVIKPNAANWPAANRRTPELRRTALSPTNFTDVATAAALQSAFTNGGNSFFAPNKYTTGPLIKDQVVAFKVAEGGTDYYGLLQVTDLSLGASPVLTCTVKVQK